MDLQVWEKTIVAWLNTLSTSTPIKNINQVNESFLRDIIKKFKPDFDECPIEFIKDIFPNLTECDSTSLSLSIDCLSVATLLLIYVSFSKTAEFDGIRELMCTRLDNSNQTNIAEFLINVQDQDVFSFSLKKIKEEILDFVGKHSLHTSVIGDVSRTPIKSNASNSSFESPLQGFFQTPKRSQPNKHLKGSLSMCGNGDHIKLIKKLTNQLVEEELGQASLQEQLNIHIQKCNDYESKLRQKIEEIAHLKSEWEIESKKSESEVQSLKSNILKKIEDEKKLKHELSHLENFVSTLENDLSNALSKSDKLEYQVKVALEKCAASESQLQEATELNMQLQSNIDTKEKELAQLREYYVNFYNDEKSIDISYLDGSFDKSVCPPENMGVVIDKLLREKIIENETLKETIEELQAEKNKLINELQSVNEKLSLKDSVVSELQYLNKELSAKVENFDLNEKELFKKQKELIKKNEEIEKLTKENSDLLEQYTSLNKGLEECEQNLLNCKNSKMLLYINFIKLAEEFKVVQKHLEREVKNISRLTAEADGIVSSEKSPAINEAKGEALKFKYESLVKIESSHPQNVHDTEDLTNSSSLSTEDKLRKLSERLQNFEGHNIEWSESKTSMQKTCDQLNENIIILKNKIAELEERQKKFSHEKIEFVKHLKESEEKIAEIQAAHFCEIKRLTGELEAKENKIKELESVIQQSKKIQEELLIEKEILKKHATSLNCGANATFIHEGGDYKNIQTENRSNNVGGIEKKINELRQEEELNDSLEEIPVCNKTFDIVNLEERNFADRTFSIKKEEVEMVNKGSKSTSAWTVSPPSKVPVRIPSKEVMKPREPRRIHGDSWVVPLAPLKSKEKQKKLSASVNDMRTKPETQKVESTPNLTKSSSLSSILEIDYSPPSKGESKSSVSTGFYSTMNKSEESRKKDEAQDTSSTENRIHKVKSLEGSPQLNFTLMEKHEHPLKEIFNKNLKEDDSIQKLMLEGKITDLQKEVQDLSQECDRLRSALAEAEQKRRKDKETFEKNQEVIRQNITAKYESQLEHLKNEMKQLYNRELAKHKAEQSTLNSELRKQNKRDKEHIDELRNQLWDLGEKLLEEQTLRRDLERSYNELKKKFESLVLYKEIDSQKSCHGSDIYQQKETPFDEIGRSSNVRHIPNATFPTIPTEDEDEVFDNRFLEDMKTGVCKPERPEGRLLELQYRNSLCLPHLKSSYPGETQFHNPNLYKETDLKFGLLPFGQESQSLTDSDQSMTKSLLPENKGKKKEQTSYKRPGPPTPSKNGGRLSIQSGDLRLTPRNVLRELNDQNERNKGTPNPLKVLLSAKSVKSGSVGSKDENTAPVTPRKKMKFFRKPFGARDH